MAAKVLLGIRDDPVYCSLSAEGADINKFANKIGGNPCFPSSLGGDEVGEKLICSMCCCPLLLVIQIDCPLENSTYHRVMYIFACINLSCFHSSAGWRVFRTQYQDQTPGGSTVMDSPSQDPAPSVCDWIAGADDWDTDNTNINSADSDITNDVIDDSPITDQAMMGDSEVFDSIQSVDSCQDFSAQQHTYPRFKPYYIAVYEEDGTDQSRNNVPDIELSDLTCQLAQSTIDDKQCKRNDRETYEKAVPKHGDITFQKFWKKVHHWPDQVIRYSWNGLALFMRQPSEGERKPPSCPLCGAQRTFELQLMPAINRTLLLENEPNNFINFDSDVACVYVYTCSNSCWDDSRPGLVTEHVFLHLDPDTETINKIFTK